MHRSAHRRVRGFNVVELVIVLMIIGILVALAIPGYRDNRRRANMTEVVLATSPCRMAVSDGWLREQASPGAGNWGCEHAAPTTRFVGRVQTTENGEIRVQVRNLASNLDGLFVYLKPYETAVPATSGGGVFEPGQAVRSWRCGVANSDVASQALMQVLPSTCRDLIDMAGVWAP